MRFQSPLSNLCDVLSQIKESARQYRNTLTSNEAATRAVLIDPVLRALGWDTANTNMVEVEKTLRAEVRADYVLYDYNVPDGVVLSVSGWQAVLRDVDC
jgi:predicted type IV restriction endonuclease